MARIQWFVRNGHIGLETVDSKGPDIPSWGEKWQDFVCRLTSENNDYQLERTID